MKQHMAVIVTAVVVTAFALISSPGVGYAEPIAPQPDAPCPESLGGALTELSDGTTVLQCRASRWHPFTDPYPASDRWLTYGPTLMLHGEGLRNPELKSGDWTAYPQDPGSTCRAEQAAVVSAGVVGAPQVSTSEPGQPLRFAVLPSLFSIKLSGMCLWQRTA
jgi:hypothetical protein